MHSSAFFVFWGGQLLPCSFGFWAIQYLQWILMCILRCVCVDGRKKEIKKDRRRVGKFIYSILYIIKMYHDLTCDVVLYFSFSGTPTCSKLSSFISAKDSNSMHFPEWLNIPREAACQNCKQHIHTNCKVCADGESDKNTLTRVKFSIRLRKIELTQNVTCLIVACFLVYGENGMSYSCLRLYWSPCTLIMPKPPLFFQYVVKMFAANCSFAGSISLRFH